MPDPNHMHISQSGFRQITDVSPDAPRTVVRQAQRVREHLLKLETPPDACWVTTADGYDCTIFARGDVLVDRAPPDRDQIEPSLPSIWQQAKNLGKTAVEVAKQAAKGGAVRVPPEVAEERMSICSRCPSFVAKSKQCSECGCYMQIKTGLAAASCPLDEPKWTAYNKERP